MATNLTEDRFYSPEEVADGLGMISAFTLRQLVRSGELHPHRLAKGKVAFTREDIQELKDYFKEPRQPGTPAEEEHRDEAFPFRTSSRSRRSVKVPA